MAVATALTMVTIAIRIRRLILRVQLAAIKFVHNPITVGMAFNPNVSGTVHAH